MPLHNATTEGDQKLNIANLCSFRDAPISTEAQVCCFAAARLGDSSSVFQNDMLRVLATQRVVDACHHKRFAREAVVGTLQTCKVVR